MTEQLTGYEASSVAEIEAILDAMPADADTVYLDTIGYSERAIAAVAAKRAGGGGAAGVAAISGFNVTMSAAMTDPGTGSVVTFDTVLSDSAAYFDTGTHTATIPTGKAGYYALSIGPLDFNATGDIVAGSAGWVEFDTSGVWANLFVPLSGTTGTNNSWWGGGTVIGHYAVGDTIQAVLFPPLPNSGVLHETAASGLVWTAVLVAT